MFRKSLIVPSGLALSAAVVLAAFSPAYAGRDSGNDANQAYLDQQYARSHPLIVPGTPPRINTPATAYGLAPSSPDARSSFAYHPVPHARRTRLAR